MADEINITHDKVSGVASDGDPTYVQGPDWDAQHVVIINPAALTAALNAFTGTLKGEVPASSGGTSNFLRADGVWATPPTTAVPSGRLIGAQYFVPTSGTYTPTPGTTHVIGRAVGGGGGSGGVPACSGNQAASGGGASGCYLEWESGAIGGPPVTGGAYSVGAAGAAGTSAPTAGGNGGDTTIVVNGVTITAKGGLGGSAGVAATSGIVAGGGTQAGSTAVTFSIQQAGSPGENISSAVLKGGAGGSTPFGAGGPAALNGSAGTAGTGQGSGGGGAATNGAARAGAPGTYGFIALLEWA